MLWMAGLGRDWQRDLAVCVLMKTVGIYVGHITVCAQLGTFWLLKALTVRDFPQSCLTPNLLSIGVLMLLCLTAHTADFAQNALRMLAWSSHSSCERSIN